MVFDDPLRPQPGICFRGSVIGRLLECPAIALYTLDAVTVTDQAKAEAGKATTGYLLTVDQGPLVRRQFVKGGPLECWHPPQVGGMDPNTTTALWYTGPLRRSVEDTP